MSPAITEQTVRIPPVALSGDLLIPAEAKGVVLFAHGSGSSRHSPRNHYVAVVRSVTTPTSFFSSLLVTTGMMHGSTSYKVPVAYRLPLSGRECARLESKLHKRLVRGQKTREGHQRQMRTKSEEILRIDGHDVNITRPDKILFPEDGIAKRDLIRYYQRIAPWMLPYLENRPLAMQRFPDGIDRPSFFQKAAAPYYPAWMKKVTVRKEGGTVKHVVGNDAATLVYLANQACITPHTWLSRIDKRNFPDQMIFDIDPSTDDLAAVTEAVLSLKEILGSTKLPAYVKATGSRGLHVAVPLDRTQDFDSVRAFARKLAEIVVARDPSRYTLEQYKNKRRGRVFIDVNRNAYAQTAVAVYAVRARRGAPVSVPLQWDELRKKDFRPDGVTMHTIFERLGRIQDPWKDFWRRATSLEEARQRLEQLHAA